MNAASPRPGAEVASLDEVLITPELARRAARPPDHAAENAALTALAIEMAERPATILRKLVELARQLCRAGSAGVSALELATEPGVFRWHAIAGELAGIVGRTMPRPESPCGMVLDRNCPLLFKDPARLFPEAGKLSPPIHETLLVPFHLGGRPIGTLWAIAHRANQHFDAEDERLLTSLSRFAAAAYGAFSARLAALNIMEDAVAARLETDRVNAELRVSEERLRALCANLPGGAAFIVNRDLRYVLAGGEALAAAGFKAEDLIGHTIAEALGPELAERYEARYREVLAGQSFTAEHRSHGRVFLTRGVPLRDAENSVYAALAVSYDITARQAAEAALAKSEERLRLIVENARDHAIVALDLDRRVTSWNSGAEHILGYREPEIMGRSADVIFTPEDRAEGVPGKEAAQAIEKGHAVDERWHVRKDGGRFWGSGLMMAMHDPLGTTIGLLKIFRDQTEARQASEALEASQADLWAALRENEKVRADLVAAAAAKDHFLAVLSHELRTPLTPVLMAVHALNLDPSLTPETREALAMIRRNVQLEAHFIDELLDLTRISRGKLEIIREPLDVHDVIHHAIEVSEPDIRAKEQRLVVVLDTTESLLSGDRSRLSQAVWNLLKNASKFTPTGGEIRLTSRNEPGRLIIEVADTGIGIAADQLSLIFDAFIQASREITRRFGGLGLGLAIAQASIAAHGGTLSAASAGPDLGATFTITLPLDASTH